MQEKSSKPDALVHRIPLALASTMKAEIESGAVKYGISAQGFIRLCVREKLERDKL